MKIEKAIEELKPCPFCGEIPKVTHEKSFTSLEFNKNYPNNGRNLYLERETYSIECTCCQQTKGYFTEDEAITAWNRRTQPENKPLSNFDRITESPQMLAEFIQGLMQGANCKNCPGTDCLDVGCLKSFERWLNKPEQEEK